MEREVTDTVSGMLLREIPRLPKFLLGDNRRPIKQSAYTKICSYNKKVFLPFHRICTLKSPQYLLPKH
jgi:hypothetical protein